jgi:hypothetical protein
MFTQLIALSMFLLLTYLLFRRPASAAPRRSPGELHIQVRPSVYINNESPKENDTSGDGGSGPDKSFPWKIASLMALILLTGMAAAG